MTCSELARRIEAWYPEATPLEIVRISTLVLSSLGDEIDNRSDEELQEFWEAVNLRLAAATDQHAAVTKDLEDLAGSDPRQFDRDKIWTLVRAIKVQSQILRMYVGDPAMEVG